MKRFLFAIAVMTIALLASALVMAQPSPSVPNLVDFQGKLTTPAGNPVPDGIHTFVFRIFDAPAAGNLLWSEGPTGIATTGGLFTHQLGSTSSLPEPLFKDTLPHWLEVEADGGIITPRTQLISHPFSRVANALESRNPFTGFTQVSTEDSYHGLSTYGCDGQEQIRLWGCSYGEIYLFDETPGNVVRASMGGFSLNPYLLLSSAVNTISLNAGNVGDPSVMLPTDAINDLEILNEPGIAHSFTFLGTVIGAIASVDAVTITAPTAGYVVVTAHGFFNYTHTVGTSDLLRAFIHTIPAAIDFDNFAFSSRSSSLPTSGTSEFESFSLTKVEAVGPGPHTYHLNADVFSGGGGAPNINRRHLTAQFYPTAYGTVISTVASKPGVNLNSAVGSDLPPSEVRVITAEEHKAAVQAEQAKQMAEMAARLKKLEEAANGKQQVVEPNR